MFIHKFVIIGFLIQKFIDVLIAEFSRSCIFILKLFHAKNQDVEYVRLDNNLIV